MDKPREYTTEEVKEEFLSHIRYMISYWEIQSGSTRDKLDGLAHTIMVCLDGNAGALPGYVVAPLDTKEDRDYLKKQGENYYPINNDKKVKCDIAGTLAQSLFINGTTRQD
jgi:hypothetical protein